MCWQVNCRHWNRREVTVDCHLVSHNTHNDDNTQHPCAPKYTCSHYGSEINSWPYRESLGLIPGRLLRPKNVFFKRDLLNREISKNTPGYKIVPLKSICHSWYHKVSDWLTVVIGNYKCSSEKHVQTKNTDKCISYISLCSKCHASCSVTHKTDLLEQNSFFFNVQIYA